MCAERDPREEVLQASYALRSIYFLLNDRAQIIAGDAELPVLIDFVSKRLDVAAKELQEYVPRDWTPPAM